MLKLVTLLIAGTAVGAFATNGRRLYTCENGATDTGSECECADGTHILVGESDDDATTYSCFDWSADCASVEADDDQLTIFGVPSSNTTITLDSANCNPSSGGIVYFWEVFEPETDDNSVEVETDTGVLSYNFDDVGDWNVDVFACSDLVEPSDDSCTTLSLTVSISCEPGQEYAEGMCNDCEPGTANADGSGACDACDSNSFSWYGWETCLSCPENSSPTEGNDGCECDDETTYVLVELFDGDDHDDLADGSLFFECVEPTLSVTFNGDFPDGSVGLYEEDFASDDDTASIERRLEAGPTGYSFSVGADFSLEVDGQSSEDSASVWAYYTVALSADINDECDHCYVETQEDGMDAEVYINEPVYGDYYLFLTAVTNDGQLELSESEHFIINDGPALEFPSSSASSEDETAELTLYCVDGFGAKCNHEAAFEWSIVGDADYTAELTGVVLEGCGDEDFVGSFFDGAVVVDDDSMQVDDDSMAGDDDSSTDVDASLTIERRLDESMSTFDDDSMSQIGDDDDDEVEDLVYEGELCIYTTAWTVTVDEPVDEPETHMFSVEYTDAYGASTASGEVSLEVAAVQFTPTFTGPQYLPSLSDWTAEQNTITFDALVADEDFVTLICTVENMDSGVSVVDSSDCSAIVLAFNAEGEFDFTVAVEDNDGHTNSQEFTAFVFADDAISAFDITLPTTTTTGWTFDAGYSFQSASFDFGSADATGQVTSATGTMVTLDVEVGEATGPGDIEFTIVLVLGSPAFERTVSGVLTVIAATPTLEFDFSEELSQEEPAYFLLTLPSAVEFTVNGAVDSGVVAQSTVSLMAGTVQLGSVSADADSVSLEETFNAYGEFSVTGEVVTDYDIDATDSQTFWVLDDIAATVENVELVIGDADITHTLGVTLDSDYSAHTYSWVEADGASLDSTSSAEPTATFSEWGTYLFPVTVMADLSGDGFSSSPVSVTDDIEITVYSTPSTDVTVTVPGDGEFVEATDVDPAYYVASLPASLTFTSQASNDDDSAWTSTSVAVQSSNGVDLDSTTATEADSAAVTVEFTASDEFSYTGSAISGADVSSAVAEGTFWVLEAITLADPENTFSLGVGSSAVTRQLSLDIESVYGNRVTYSWTADSSEEGSNNALFAVSEEDGSVSYTDTSSDSEPDVYFSAEGTYEFTVTVSANLAAFEGTPVTAELTISVDVLSATTSEVTAVATGPAQYEVTENTASFDLSALDSSSTIAPDDDVLAELAYAWTAAEPSLFSFDDATAVDPTVSVTGDLTAASYDFTVTVTDAFDTEASATVTVLVSYLPTITLAASGDVISLGDDFSVTATAADADEVTGDLTYAFTITWPDTTTTTTTQTSATFTPDFNDVAGVFGISATVTDALDGLTSVAASVSVDVYTEPTLTMPVDVSVTKPSEEGAATVTLTATATDAVDAAADLTWEWSSDVDGVLSTTDSDNVVSISSDVDNQEITVTVTVTNTFGTGEDALSTTGSVVVTILPTTETVVSVEIADVELVVLPTSTVELDGSNSFSSRAPNDPVASGLEYSWTVNSQPDGADAQFDDATVAVATATGLSVSGEYVFDLTVTDLNDQEDTSSVTVTVTQAPTISVTDNAFIKNSETIPETFTFDFSASTDEDGDDFTVAYSASDSCSGVDTFTLNADSLVLSGLDRGFCAITLTATDALGASSSVEVYYQAVQISITSPTSLTTWYQTQSFPISWTATGFGDGHAELRVRLENPQGVRQATTITLTSETGIAGSGSVTFTVPTDYSGAKFNSNDGSTFYLKITVVDSSGDDTTDSVTTPTKPDDADLIDESGFSILPPFNFDTSVYGTCVAANGACGVGTKTRTVKCLNSNNVLVDNSFCLRYSAKPVSSTACISATACTDPEWLTGDWSDTCTTTQTDLLGACGSGTRSRTVTCYDETGAAAEDSACDGITKPSETQFCSAGLCKTFEYAVRSQGSCSADCHADGAASPTKRQLIGCRNANSGFWVSTSICKLDNTLVSPASSVNCNENVACPTYAFDYGAYSTCSESCGSEGTRTRTAVCRDDAGEGDEVDASNCGTAVTSVACNRFPCSYNWYVVGAWTTECALDDSTATCGTGTYSRDLYCVSSTDPTELLEDLTGCGGAGGFAVSRACEIECNFCDTTECSGQGTCDTDAEVCNCNNGFSGTYCETADDCDGVLDGEGNCCDSVVTGASPANDDPFTCCDVVASDDDWATTPVLDVNGDCCLTGQVDSCGNCCADATACEVVVDLAGDCCADDALDAQGLCCDGEVDSCGVCGGSDSCATAVTASCADCYTPSDDITTCEELLGDEASVSELEASYIETMAELLGVSESRVTIDGFSCSTTRRLSRSLLQADEVDAEITIAPGAEGSVAVDTFAVAEAVDGSDFAASSIDAAGVCGNDVCEVGEQCAADGANADECCLQDCPLVAQECAVPENGDGSECGGHGTCIASAGSCECFTTQGYDGDACDQCAVGYYAVGTGADFVCAVQVESTVEDADDDSFIDRDDALRVLSVLLPMLVLAFVIFMVFAKKKGICGIKKVQRRKQPLFSEQTVKSAELTSI